MKFNQLLLIAFLGGHAMPAIGMDNPSPKNWSAFLPNPRAIVNDLCAHPFHYLSAVAIGGMVGAFGAKFWNTYGNDIEFKIGCYRGTISPQVHLLRAIQKNDLADAQWALNRGANPNNDRDEAGHQYLLSLPIRDAIHQNNNRMVELLIKNGADVTSGHALMKVLIPDVNGRFDTSIARKLIEAGGNNTEVRYLWSGSRGAAFYTAQEIAEGLAARTGNQDYINIFKTTKLL